MKHILSYLCERPWAITSRAMETMHRIVEREGDLEAVAARLGERIEKTTYATEKRGAIAVLNVEGPIFRYANLFTAFCGATSIEMLARDFNVALDDKSVEGILVNVNSPGGEADGLCEMADMIHAGRDKKPIYAYVGGLGASGGYWLAAAAKEVYAHASALVGSIGVVASVYDDRGEQEKTGVRKYEIVSSQSPRKRADVTTEGGRAQIQEMVDAMADIFIGRVAMYRGVSAEDVTQKFGQGGVLPGAKAQRAGMIDAVSSFESVLAAMNSEASKKSFSIAASGAASSTQEDVMADDKKPDAAQLSAQERKRIKDILESAEAKGREKFARHLALETNTEVAVAIGFLAAAAQDQPPPAPAPPAEPKADQLTERMRALGNPVVGIDSGKPVDDDAAEIAAVVQYLPEAQRRRHQ